MGRRTSAARSVPGNALAGVLRGPQRNARAATRRVLPAPQPDQPESEAVAPVATMAATVLACDSDGVARWDFPAALDDTPVIVATAAATQPATVTLADVTPDRAVLQVWDADGEPLAGATVHAVAYPQQVSG
jgi:hypothetical protein